ncbi:uncharacterized protein LOC120103627 isoform X2 [Rattus norvegicus]|uniref:uncharacterized protein LOC120103627 isoform X2 n=1 Tax=Rattus norvegicus TaxID=10116 RepID=UPI002FD7C4E0
MAPSLAAIVGKRETSSRTCQPRSCGFGDSSGFRAARPGQEPLAPSEHEERGRSRARAPFARSLSARPTFALVPMATRQSRAYRLASLFRRPAGQRCGLPESQTRPGPDSARPQRARARVPAETGPPKLRHTRGRSRGRAAILPPPWPAARDSPFSSNKDINPTRLARDWEEEALETGSGATGPAASGGAAGQVPPPSSGRDCPSDVRVHTSSAEPGDLAGTQL